MNAEEQRSKMQALRAQGLTLREIGERCGVSRQRVHQVLGRTGDAPTNRAGTIPTRMTVRSLRALTKGRPLHCGDEGMHWYGEGETCACGQIPREIFFAGACTCGASRFKKPVHRADCAAVAWMEKRNAWIDAHPEIDPPLDRVRYRVADEGTDRAGPATGGGEGG